LIEFKKAVAREILDRDGQITSLYLDIDHPIKKAINYNQLTGPVEVGDILLVNTTAGTLGLGTGGVHFVMANLSGAEKELIPGGHGMKLKYTPIQSKLLLSEEAGSPYHSLFNEEIDFNKKVVYVGELHSMLPPLCAYLKYMSKGSLRIAYIMTDHGALPLCFSRNVLDLKKKNLLDITVTTGNAFGGDFECVNIYTALKAALNIGKCDIAILSMGPGILGTNTRYGFSGLELGLYVNLIHHLGGNCIYIPRIGFGDSRIRHRGISHHSLTVLRDIIDHPTFLIFPLMPKEKAMRIIEQLRQEGLFPRNPLLFYSGYGIQKAMEYYQVSSTTMGRSIKEDPFFFYELGAVGRYGLKLLDRMGKRMV